MGIHVCLRALELMGSKGRMPRCQGGLGVGGQGR